MCLLQTQQERMRINLRCTTYQYEIDHTHIHGWVRIVKHEQSSRAYELTNRENSTNGNQKEDENFCLTDKPLITLCMTLGCLDG